MRSLRQPRGIGAPDASGLPYPPRRAGGDTAVSEGSHRWSCLVLYSRTVIQGMENEMSELTALLDRNRSFAGKFEGGDLPIRPRMSTFILTCIDSRVDPAHLFELGLGDAIVIRNGGGWITPAVLRDLAILGVLADNLPGPGAPKPELVVIHHTDCGMGRLAIPAIQQQLAERLGVSNDEVAAMAITDPTATVKDDIERLRHTPGTSDQLVVSGLLYDVADGTITEVVAPAPLRVTA